MRGLRRLNGLAWLAIIALLGNAIAGGLPRAAPAGSIIDDEVLGHLVICMGGAVSNLPSGNTGDPGGNTPLHQDHCPACALASKLAVALPTLLALPAYAPPCASVPIPPPHEVLGPVQLRPGGTQSRAPPFSA
jgi:hypothetical protein